MLCVSYGIISMVKFHTSSLPMYSYPLKYTRLRQSDTGKKILRQAMPSGLFWRIDREYQYLPQIVEHYNQTWKAKLSSTYSELAKYHFSKVPASKVKRFDDEQGIIERSETDIHTFQVRSFNDSALGIFDQKVDRRLAGTLIFEINSF